MAMGTKRSRTSPKKSEKESTTGAGQTRRDLEWVTSTSSEEDLNGLVIEGMLPNKETAGWRAAAGEEFPTPHTHELVVFKAYFVRGFGIPAHPFLRNLLRYYRINLCHLIPTAYCAFPFSLICAMRSSESLHISISSTIFSASSPSPARDLPRWSVGYIYSFGMGWRINTSTSHLALH